jgi:hypothetical protein
LARRDATRPGSAFRPARKRSPRCCDRAAAAIGDSHQLVEIKVAAVLLEFPGDRQWEPKEFVQVEMGTVVADDGS